MKIYKTEKEVLALLILCYLYFSPSFLFCHWTKHTYGKHQEGYKHIRNTINTSCQCHRGWSCGTGHLFCCQLIFNNLECIYPHLSLWRCSYTIEEFLFLLFLDVTSLPPITAPFSVKLSTLQHGKTLCYWFSILWTSITFFDLSNPPQHELFIDHRHYVPGNAPENSLLVSVGSTKFLGVDSCDI